MRGALRKREFIACSQCTICGVRGGDVERWPRNHKAPSSIPESGCHLWDFHWPTHSLRVRE